ncbi:MAG: NADH-quinone oxidoreductase subunit D [Planctomycetes bacterium]|nr:NADH-quinone oxidoreductase subunit D [Planctomycetota bacterium]
MQKAGLNNNHAKSFYHLTNFDINKSYCSGTACLASRRLNQTCWKKALEQTVRVHCLGKCYMSPACGQLDSRPIIKCHSSKPIVLKRIIEGGFTNIGRYVKSGGFLGLKKTLSMIPEEVIRIIEQSGLRGRGGAGFPAGKKWRSVFSQKSKEKFVIANADEGDPGAYTDRFIMEEDPYSLIESMVIAAYAVGASKGYIYLRKEYPKAHTALQQALLLSKRNSFLGENIFGTKFSFEIKIVVGQGSYVCGEETALINSIEGKRPEVMARPPYPTESGLFGKPTLVNNVETFVNIPWIIVNGAGAYSSIGFSNSKGTKVVSLNSLFRNPGLYEIEFGVSLRTIIEELGGELQEGRIKGVIVGGPLAGIVPPHMFDTKFGFEELRQIGSSVGHGGVIVFDTGTPIAELIQHIFDFSSGESCGKCTPCRVGSRSIETMFSSILEIGNSDGAASRKQFEEIVSALESTSLCGLGTGLADFAKSVFRYYEKELSECFKW